ncbi:hypothetical protein FQA47_013881 [Oryzias melastigma]|uniref:Uncharacterized protein n=1 Tax=Oryzias melastigma TaxID=30732 RepID=A0A834F1I9_ORYME|nr:hypothetical protein FQA47_013881 [Oryzias melastigma]
MCESFVKVRLGLKSCLSDNTAGFRDCTAPPATRMRNTERRAGASSRSHADVPPGVRRRSATQELRVCEEEQFLLAERSMYPPGTK